MPNPYDLFPPQENQPRKEGRKYSREELEFLAAKLDEKAGSVYVLMNDKGTTLVRDPALDRPWSNRNKRLAESMAREQNGLATRAQGKIVVVTLADAIKILIQNFSDDRN